MSAKAKAIRTLYRAKRITVEGARQAVTGGVISEEEYAGIVGEEYAEPIQEPSEEISGDELISMLEEVL